jgi:HEPN domain-containing protein
VKGLHLHLGQEAWGHLVARLLRELPVPVPDGLVDRGMVLDTFCVPSRCPNSHPRGRAIRPLQSEEAIGHAREILAFVRSQMA